MTRLALTALASAFLLAAPAFAISGPDAEKPTPSLESGSSTILADCPGKKHVNA